MANGPVTVLINHGDRAVRVPERRSNVRASWGEVELQDGQVALPEHSVVVLSD